MSIWHIVLSADGRNPFFIQEEDRRSTIHNLARAVGEHLILFSLVDEHFHAVVFADQAKVGRLKRSIRLIVRRRSLSAVDPAHVRPVDSRAYMKWLVHYTLDQVRKHQLPVHPALWTGSCFMDLAGARRVEGFHLRRRLGEALPRFRTREAYKAVGLPEKKLTLPTEEDLRRLGPYRLSESAAAALCVPHPLAGNLAPVAMARAAVCRIARAVGIRTAETAHALGITPQAVGRLADKSLADPIWRSVALHVSLERAVQESRIHK